MTPYSLKEELREFYNEALEQYRQVMIECISTAGVVKNVCIKKTARGLAADNVFSLLVI